MNIKGVLHGIAAAAVLMLSEGLRLEVKPYKHPNDGDLPWGSGERTAAVDHRGGCRRMHKFYEAFAIPADSFTRAVAFAIGQPDEVDVNEILFRPTRQEL